MTTPSLPDLRRALKTMLEKEDNLINEYARLHEGLHSCERLLRTSRAPVNPPPLVMSTLAEFFYEMNREELAELRPQIRQVAEQRRELLRRIIEMEKEEKFGVGSKGGVEVKAEVDDENKEGVKDNKEGVEENKEGVEDEAQEDKEHEGQQTDEDQILQQRVDKR